MRVAIGVIAPWSLGMSDSSLVAGLDERRAAKLEAAFLRDALLVAVRVSGASVTVFHDPDVEPEGIRRLAPADVAVAPSSSSDPDGELIAGLQDLLAEGADRAVVIDARVPLLSPHDIERSIALLRDGAADMVAGPEEGGGSYLIAAGADHTDLLASLEWDNAQVLRVAVQTGLCVKFLEQRYVAEDLEGLKRLAADLAVDGSLGADATRSALRSLARDGLNLFDLRRPWWVRGREKIFESPWRSLVVDEVETHGGDTISYSYVEAPDAVWVVPVTVGGEVILIRQYRHPIRDWSVEVPAGSGDEGPVRIAARELREEIGGRAAEIRLVGAYYPAAAHLDVRGHVCLALGVEVGEAEREPGELLVPFAVPFEVALDMARRGEVSDAQSAIAVLACEAEIRSWLAGRGR